MTLPRADLEDMIAALCMVASIAHCSGDRSSRDAAVDWAAEMAEELVSPGENEPSRVRDSSLRC